MIAIDKVIHTLSALCCIVFLVGCNRIREEEQHNIVCIHSYGESGQEGNYFRKLMDREFLSNKINANVTHIYLDLISHEFPFLSMYGGTSEFVREICRLNPEIILINDDLALEHIISNCDTILRMQPVVFAGVSAMGLWERGEYPQLCGIFDRITLSVNTDMVQRLNGSRNVTIELGHGGYQDNIRTLLYQNISDTSRFINNSDFAIDTKSGKNLPGNIKDRVIVDFISAESPKSNKKDGAPDKDGELMIKRAETTSKLSVPSQIQVKYDIFSNVIVDIDGRPQFTCIREMFGSESKENENKVHTRFLCGYFANVETQIRDQVLLASRIINGADPTQIESSFHEQNYYMDWIAMQACNPPLEYKDFKDRFNIINAPLLAKYKFLYNFLIGVLIFIVSLGIAAICIHSLGKRKKQKVDRLEELHAEIEKRSLALDDLETGFFMIKDDLVTFYFGFAEKHELESNVIPIAQLKKTVHPDYRAVFKETLFNANSANRQNKIRIKLDFNGKGWHWWTLYLDSPAPGSPLVIGSIINIDNVVELEDNARETAMKAEEVLSKENFIANITHDIRTPLNAISGFSELLLDSDTSAEDREEYMNIISDNTDQLLNLLEEAAMKGADSTDSMSFKVREINFDKLMSDSYKTNSILCPQNLEFRFEPDSHGDTKVLCDSIRTCQVINNFLSNSFKYTPAGSVTLGWKLVDDGKSAEVYVRDTGIGISEEDKKIINQRYGRALGNKKGTGLGLDICQQIIALQNGQYGFESELGKGSCFHFTLPVFNKPEKAE